MMYVRDPGMTHKSIERRSLIDWCDADAFAHKWKKFTTDGIDQLLVIADFDYTLTPFFKDGTGALTQHLSLSEAHRLTLFVRRRACRQLSRHSPQERCARS